MIYFQEGEEVLFPEPKCPEFLEPARTADCSNSHWQGAIGEKVFELKCLRLGINLLTSVAENTRVDRVIENRGKYYRIHIKSSSTRKQGRYFSFFLQGRGYYGSSRGRETRLSASADYFACVWTVEGEETIWWLPYEKYKNCKMVYMNHNFDCYKTIPAELL